MRFWFAHCRIAIRRGIVLMLEHFRAQHLDAIPVSAPEFVDYQTNCRSFDKMAVFQPGTFNFAGGDRPERIFGAVGSADLFKVLGVTPIRGRVFEGPIARLDTTTS